MTESWPGHGILFPPAMLHAASKLCDWELDRLYFLDISLHGPPSGRLLSQTRKEEERRGCFSPTEPHKSEYEANIVSKARFSGCLSSPHLST